MNIIEVKNKETLKELENGSALTFTGLAEESFGKMLDWVKSHTKLKREDVYVTKGSLMNSAYGLTGDNAYPDDLNLVSLKLDDLENYDAIVMPRFEVGGRWMDDIVDNNARKQAEIAA